MDADIRKLDDEVRNMLSEDLPAQRASFRTALAQDDFPRAASEVHTIRGTAAFCRLDQLRESASALEQSLDKKEKNAELIRAFERDVDAVLRLLHSETT